MSIFNNNGEYLFERESGSVNVMGNHNSIVLRNSQVAVTINGNSNFIDVRSSRAQFSVNGNNNNVSLTGGTKIKIGFNGNNNRVQLENGSTVECSYVNGMGNIVPGIQAPRESRVVFANGRQQDPQINVNNPNPRRRGPINNQNSHLQVNSRGSYNMQAQQRVRPNQHNTVVFTHSANQPGRNTTSRNNNRQQQQQQGYQYPQQVNPFLMNNQFRNLYQVDDVNRTTASMNHNQFQFMRGMQEMQINMGQLQNMLRMGGHVEAPRGRNFRFRFYPDGQNSSDQQQYEDYFEEDSEEQEQPIALTQQQLNLLPSSAHKGPVFKCSICLDEVTEGEAETYLFCIHSFHSECIFDWLIRNPKCPLCQQNVKKNLEQISSNAL